MAPSLLLGFLVAGILSVFISPAAVERHLGGRGILSVLKAAAFGVPLPLCSCGVIPVSASLRRHGASPGATTAFLISTPQTGVDSIAITYSLLGWAFALFRPIAALISGIIGGAVVDLAEPDEAARATPAPVSGGAGHAESSGGRIKRILIYAASTLPRDLARPLIFGLIVAALISSVLPEEFFRNSLGPSLTGGIMGILIMMALGIPLYVCATASVPIAWALIHQGVSPGAAFAFLVAGPATNAATIGMVWRVMGRRTALLYLATIALSAIAGGLIMDNLIVPLSLVSISPLHHGAHNHMAMTAPGSVVGILCAVTLLVILGVALLRGEPDDEVAAATGDDAIGCGTVTIGITGMTCSQCAAAVERALREVPGVKTASVNLSAGTATVGGTAPDPDAMRHVVEALGYKVTAIVAPSA